jgi:rhodanese-related sulfurtransferase
LKAKFLIGLLVIPLLMIGCSKTPATTVPPTTEVVVPPTTVKTTAPTSTPPVVSTTAKVSTTAPVVSTTPPVVSTTKPVQPTTNLPTITPQDYYNNYVVKSYNPDTMKTVNPNYLSIDARGIDQYNQSHIPDAFNINPVVYGTDSEKQSIINNMLMLPKGVLLVFFDDDMTLAPGLAQSFLDLNQSRNLGYDPAMVKVLAGGFTAWRAADYPGLSAAQ